MKVIKIWNFELSVIFAAKVLFVLVFLNCTVTGHRLVAAVLRSNTPGIDAGGPALVPGLSVLQLAQDASAAQTISVIATDADGTNTGTARLGVPVTLHATVTGQPHHLVAWRVAGGGAISWSGTDNANGTYVPPAQMSGNASVTITAYLQTLPSVTASYTVTLINPTPSIGASGGIAPNPILTGGTQTVTLRGAGFIPGSTVSVNGGNRVPTTYIDYNHAQVQVPVAANATGSITLQAFNPAPGGGASATISDPVASPAIALSAHDQDGTNTGTAELGTTVSMTAKVTGSVSTSVNWSVAGGGSITSSGVYTAPSVLSGSSSVTITATLASNAAITSSYRLILINPAPHISSIAPTQLPAGSTSAVTLTGTGFVTGTTLVSSQGTVTATYQSPTTLVANVTLAESASGTLTLQAQNPAPGGGQSNSFQLPVWLVDLTATDSDGVNTGTARLGSPVILLATAASGSHKVIAWQLQGPGTLVPFDTNGVHATYTPPAIMPANASVTIGVSMYSYPVVDTSYTLTLINPVPAVAATTPAQLLTGGTQTVALMGSGFVPSMTVLLNGSAVLPTTYIDYNHATVQVPVTATAAADYSLQVQNPAPGGGAGFAVKETIEPNSIALTATDADGQNTGTAELGVQVTMAAAVTGSEQTAVNWSVSGPGSINSSGVYTAPAVLPVSTAATITASLASNPLITAAYTLNVINPVPILSTIAPDVIPAGATTVVTLSGSGFVPKTVVLVNGAPVPATYLSATRMTAEITLSAGATGNLSIKPQNPLPGGGTGPETEEAVSAPVSATAAARILDQTTFGPTAALIAHVQREGVTSWLEEQFNTSSTVLAAIPENYPAYCGDAAHCMESEWWKAALNGNDQFRQRVAFALSELFVVSANNIEGQGLVSYANLLASDAFTNWSTIVHDVTLSPTMAIYLNMLNSRAAGPGQIANENFARENMQLFNMGLNLLNQDGSLQLDGSGNPIPSYTEADVASFSKVYTGWTFANADGSTPPDMIGTVNYDHSLVPIEYWHDQTAKVLLNGTTLSAGQTAEQDLADGLANIIAHPNVPPFVARQLITHLVTGDPSPAYVSRVAAVFANNGNNVRGDMKSVLTAILTDPEARAGDTNPAVDGGHLREPILWLTAAMRGLGYVSIDPNDYYQRLSGYSGALGEIPYNAISVFNFFPPSYTVQDPLVPGTILGAPEFALENTGSVIDRLSLSDYIVNNQLDSFNVDLSATSPLGLLASNPDTLINQLSLIFMHNQMDAYTHSVIKAAISPLTDMAQRVRIATFLVISSSSYKILH